jgi:hypothetical protein
VSLGDVAQRGAEESAGPTGRAPTVRWGVTRRPGPGVVDGNANGEWAGRNERCLLPNYRFVNHRSCQFSRPMRPANFRTSEAYDGLARLTSVLTMLRAFRVYKKILGADFCRHLQIHEYGSIVIAAFVAPCDLVEVGSSTL